MPTDHDNESADDARIELGLADGELAEAAATLDDAFADYPIDLRFTADSLRAMFPLEDVLPEACALARGPGGEVLGVGLAALRAERGRIAAMGVRRDAHRSGVGLIVGRALLDALAGAGAREVILEALTENAPALALYEEQLGFERRRRLVGFTREPGGEPISPARWEEALAPGDEPDSWQLPLAIGRTRQKTDVVSVPAVVPEHHAVAQMLREAGFAETPIDQYELSRPL